MECKAKLVSVSNDILTGSYNITFSVNDNIINSINDLKDKELSLKAVKWHEKRPLNANAYCWHLCTELAKVHNTSKDEIYEQFIQDESVYEQDDNGFVVITVKSCVDMTKITGHWKYYSTSKDGKFKSYIMLKGSSQFDKVQMNHFLQMIVEACKQDGIDTVTPDELRQIGERWGIKNQL